MKTLQNDLTTIEQSKRLLELGVPKNSANHYYGKDGKLHYIYGTIPYSLLWATGCTPCWSVGRLIEIMQICCDRVYVLQPHEINIMQVVIEDICALKEVLDFSKLEEE